MVKTKINGEIKSEIFEYLDNTVKRRSWKIEDFTLASISKNVGVEEETVKKILEELSGREKELVKSIKIETDIYLPTKGSEKIEKSLKIKKLITPVSPYLAFVVVIGVLYVLAPYFVINAPAARDILVIALFAGPISAYILQQISKEYLRWKVTSEKMYKDIYRLYKFSAYLIILLVSLLIGYYVFSWLTRSEMMPEIVGGIVVIFVGAIITRAAHFIWKYS